LPVVKSTTSLAFDHSSERCTSVDSLERDIADANLYRAHKGKAALDPEYRVAKGAAFIAMSDMNKITPAANAWRLLPAKERASAKRAAKPVQATAPAKPGKIASAVRAVVAAVTSPRSAAKSMPSFAHLLPHEPAPVAPEATVAEQIVAAGKRRRGEV
jgi:hypothetical protein